MFFANYLVYADEGFTAFLDAIGCRYVDLEALGVFLVYAQSSCAHRGSARFGDHLDIHTRVTRVGRTSLGLAVEVRRGDEVLAEVQLVSVCLALDDRRPVPLPEMLRNAVENWGME